MATFEVSALTAVELNDLKKARPNGVSVSDLRGVQARCVGTSRSSVDYTVRGEIGSKRRVGEKKGPGSI